MNTLEKNLELASQDNNTEITKRRYGAPEIRVAGTAVALVQGCGGGAGSDSRYYRIHC
jgi:hypothetical protein